MANSIWPTKRVAVAGLHLDAKNPRLGRETSARAPRDIIQYLFAHDKAVEVAESIAARGFFPNEPLLAVKENDQLVVVEGNRRLAALKALREPGLLAGPLERRLERLARQIVDPQALATVPVTIAPNRRATDRQIAGRHIGTPVLSWQAEYRASFILEKLAEGYGNQELSDELGFSLADIQKARQTRALADMARSLPLPDEVRAKLEIPRAKIFTTLERVFDSSVGRKYLKVEPDPDHGLRGTTTVKEFARGFTRLVTDVVLGKQSSRSLNTNEDIAKYFDSWPLKDRPADKRGSFVPSDVIRGDSVASPRRGQKPAPAPKRSKQISKTVLPRDFRVRFGSERLVDIRRELTKLKRDDFPNAGAVLLRVFFEIAVLDYLERTGDLQQLIERLKEKNKLRRDTPELKDLRAAIIRIARAKLSPADATRVEKAVRLDRAAPFGLDDLHAFVHQAQEFPGGNDIRQFWARTEPLFRLMLEQPT